MVQVNYKKIRDSYKAIKDHEDIYKERAYYSCIDSTSGSYKDAQAIANKVIDDLDALEAKNELCITANVVVKHNDHDFGAYYNVEINIVGIYCDDYASEEVYRAVEDYTSAGREQLEHIIARYSV